MQVQLSLWRMICRVRSSEEKIFEVISGSSHTLATACLIRSFLLPVFWPYFYPCPYYPKHSPCIVAVLLLELRLCCHEWYGGFTLKPSPMYKARLSRDSALFSPSALFFFYFNGNLCRLIKAQVSSLETLNRTLPEVHPTVHHRTALIGSGISLSTVVLFHFLLDVCPVWTRAHTHIRTHTDCCSSAKHLRLWSNSSFTRIQFLLTTPAFPNTIVHFPCY